MIKPCTVCHIVQETKHLPLYVRGSEGLDVCHFCEMALVEVVRELMNMAGRARKVCHMEKQVVKGEEGIEISGENKRYYFGHEYDS